ncbi:MAG: cytochrome C [Alphaproteobacteria bacterium BRH_c36]|nr:MAG: cytochrome C [Alphaproteobacteria bacterium BRH_c36]
MKGSSITNLVFAIALVVLAGMLMAHFGVFGRANTSSNGVLAPTLSGEALAGQAVFEANCASCHGVNGVGTNKGPPLVHDIYNPGHHSDAAFHRAVRNGVQQHHWPYGNMPAQTQVSEADVAKILSYVRDLQEVNGIRYRPHRM